MARSNGERTTNSSPCISTDGGRPNICWNERLFGPLPDLTQRDGATAVFVNIGKSIAAYERRIQHAPSRFDRYVDALTATGRAPAGILSVIAHYNRGPCSSDGHTELRCAA